MAGSPVSRRARRDRASGGDNQQRLIYIGAAVILALVLIVVAVGVVLTVILPPRAHVLTVGDAKFTAGEVADRAAYLAATRNQNAQRDPAGTAIDALIGQEVLLQVGADRVEVVTEQQVRDAVAEQLGLSVPGEGDANGGGDPAASPTPNAVATGEASATPGGTATPEPTPYTDEQYGDALASFLQVAPISRDELETIARAGIIEDRLLEQFREEVPETGDQMLLSRVATNDRAAAQRLIDLVRGGAEFADAAVEAGIVASVDEVTELGRFAPQTLNERIAPAVQDLQAGEVSEIVDDQRQVGYEVYYVVERSADQPYEDSVREQLAVEALEAWRTEQEATLNVVRDLSDGEDEWIREQVLDYLAG